MSEARFGADFERKLSLAVRMPIPRPEFVSTLRNSLANEKPLSGKGRGSGISLFRLGVLLVGVLAAVLLSVFLALGPEKVSAWIRNIMGYIPGVGSVSDVSTALILEKPVEASRGDFTVRVLQAIADNRHVGIRAEVTASPASFYQYQDFGAVDIHNLRIRPLLRLDSGAELELIGSSGPGYDDRVIVMQFPPLPEGTRSTTLVMDILWFEFPSGDPSWVMEFPLHFRPIAKGDVIPVIEIPGAQPEDLPTMAEAGAPADLQASASQNGVDFVLEKIIPFGEQTILAGSYRWTNPEWAYVAAFETLPIWLTDSQGREVPIQPYAMEDEIGRNDPGRIGWSVITEPGDFQGPWILTLDSTEIFLLGTASFVFDPGANPQLQQKWSLDQPLDIDGYSIQVVYARLLPFHIMFDGLQDDYALEFQFRADSPVWGISLADTAGYIQGAGVRTDGGITACVYYEKNFPSGPREIQVGISIKVDGPWVIKWE
jgi:hypothetical protein